MLPGESDATVDLDVLGRGVEVGLRAVGLGERGDRGQLVVHLTGAPESVVRGALRRLDLEQHVGALVLDRLEGADGATELDAVLGVLDGHVEHELRATDLLGGEADRGEVEDGLEDLPAATVGSDERGRGRGELEAGLLAGLVHGRERGALEAGGITVDREEADTGGRPRRHDDQVGGVPVEDVGLGAGQGVSIARGGRLHGDAALVPAARRLGEGEGGDGGPSCDAREVRRLGGVVTGLDERVGREHHGGEERGAQQGAAHLLEDDAEFDVAEAGTAVLLGDVQTLESHLLGHLAPYVAVEAGLGLHLLAHRLLGALGFHEGADGAAQFVLFLGEGEVHAASVSVGDRSDKS